MSGEGLEKIYPDGKDIEPIYPAETDAYLTDLEAEDTFRTPEEMAKQGIAPVDQMLNRAKEEVRSIEVSRKALGYYASVFAELVSNHPDFVEKLPSAYAVQVKELASRVGPPAPEETTISGRQMTTIHLPPEPQGE